MCSHACKYFLLLTLIALVLAFFPSFADAQQVSRPVVVIEPGHGWSSDAAGTIDPGAVRYDLVEKDITLDIASRVTRFLANCPLDVHLIRTGDDPGHTLEDVDEIVNALNPKVGVAIHINASTNQTISGAEGWYTNGGVGDDEASQRLARLLAGHVAEAMSLPNLGTKPEDTNRHGRLYIHWWKAPAALIELAYMDADAELLRSQRSGLAMAVAHALLSYLGISQNCADQPQPLLLINPIAHIDGFGIGSAHIRVGTEGLKSMLDAQHTMGIRWAREEIPWELVEPEQDNFRWSYRYDLKRSHDFDKLLSELHQRNIEVVAVLDYGPRYLQGDPEHGDRVLPEILLSRWRTYVQRVVNQFGDRINYWEIQNEVNSREFWGKVVTENSTKQPPDVSATPDPWLYAKMLHVAHDIIKGSDPNDVVIASGLAGYHGDLAHCATNYSNYLVELYDVGAWGAFDVVAVHPYRVGPDNSGHPPETIVERGMGYDLAVRHCTQEPVTYSLLQETRLLRDLVLRLGTKPIWITEIGWQDPWLNQSGYRSGQPDVVRADYLVRTYVLLLSEPGVDKVFWYTQVDDQGFALGTNGQDAMRTTATFLTNSRPLGQVHGQSDLGRPGDDDVYEYRFEKDGALIVVLWKARGGEVYRDVAVDNLDGGTLRMYMLDTKDLTATGGEEVTIVDGKVVVHLNEHPVFLVVAPRTGWDRFWHDLKRRFADLWSTLRDKLTKWWGSQWDRLKLWSDAQLYNLQQQIDRWLNDLNRWMQEEIQHQLEAWLHQICGSAVVPGGLVIAYFTIRRRRI